MTGSGLTGSGLTGEVGDHLDLALWQCAPLPPERTSAVEDNLVRLEWQLAQLSGQVSLLVTPEMFVSGYHIGADARAARAELPDGPIAAAVSQMCATYGVALIYGCAEIGDDGLIYNVVRVVDATGRQLGSHRKTHLFGQVDADFAPGVARAPMVAIGRWQVGVLTCYEVEFPEMVRSLAVRGADLICVPTANMPAYDAVQRILLPARALESQVYLGYANYVGAEHDLEYGGLSEVVGPGGEILAAAGRAPEIVRARIERAVLAESRTAYPYLADRRPDLY